MADRIEKTVELRAPIERVWRALTDPEEFGSWFRVRLDGPFEVGEVTTGQITYEGYEHFRWLSRTVRKDDEAYRLAFMWSHPADPARPRSDDPETLVEFTLEPTPNGTRLTLVETGFESLPAERRANALRDNESGWTTQMENVRQHVER